MSYQELRIVFMGTPEFAVSSLQALLEHECNVVGVITAPDKPRGRGKKVGISAVKEYAINKRLNILQPTNLKAPGFLVELEALEADIQVVVAFRMLPIAVWNMPPLGTFNLHASLLPNYRGAAPINWAIINGEKETGVTTFFLRHEIDTGSIIYQEKTPISKKDTLATLYQRLMHMGSKLVVETLKAIAEGSVEAIEQIASDDLKHAPKIFKEDCVIDWNQSAEKINNLIRGLSPHPAAWTRIHGRTMKIYGAEISNKKIDVGVFQKERSNSILVGTKDFALRLIEVQMEGKKRMITEEMLRGYHWPNSEKK
ncbi:MAG: methionyl-tRNA formyltransferase [Cyclobacteriaceae bacterium]